MISERCVKNGILLASVVVALTVLTSVPRAFAATPWWHLTSGSRPAVLQAGAAKDEVQNVIVEGAPGTEFVLVEPVAMKKGEFKFTRLPSTADAEELQAGLETIYGAGNVAVSGGAPFRVTFKGAKASQRVPPMLPFGPVSVSEAVRGRPDGEIVLVASNLGDAPLDARESSVSISDHLPPGITPVSIEGLAGETTANHRGTVECDIASLVCKFGEGTLPPYWPIEVVIGVRVDGNSTQPNVASVLGGQGPEEVEVPGASVKREVQVGNTPAQFGVEEYELIPEEEGGVPDTQAGSHPFQITTTLALNQKLSNPFGSEPTAPFESVGLLPRPIALPKDFHFKWPPGLIGNPTPVPRCATAEFISKSGICAQQTAVGVAMVTLIVSALGPADLQRVVTPVYNMEPGFGEPARFAFHVAGVSVFIDPSVRAGSDSGITVSVNNISQAANVLSSEVTVWGVPGDSRHDISRGFGCLQLAAGSEHPPSCTPSQDQHPPPFITMPTSCTGPLLSTLEADSWVEPKSPGEGLSRSSEQMPAMDGCNRLPFAPSIEVKPDSAAASTPTGLTVNVHVPQGESLNPTGFAEADPRTITVALPPGVAVNPSGGDGLQACSEGSIGFTGFQEPELQPTGSVATFTSSLPSPLLPGVNFCSDASKIGTAEIVTPLLPADQHIKGAVYLANQNENPFGSLIAMYIVAEDPISGVLIKLVGQVHLSDTGQLVTTFENSPQAPFEDAELHFFGGERAPLASPAHCGAYTTEAAFTPWSAEPGEAPRTASSTFNITSGPNGSPCPGPVLPFSPSLDGGTTNIQAGAFSSLTTTMSRADGNQDLSSVQLHMPPGLSGLLTGVKLCPEQQANDGTCGPESQIGETTVSAGVGSDPVSVKGGKVYITEKYAGAPFGLSIVNPVKAGPIDLEHDTSNPANQPACDCIVVRAKVEVDPVTAALTVTTDPTGPHKIPSIIDGIPVNIQHVNVIINRPGFTFNPTNCNPLAISGKLLSDEASSTVSVPFQVTNCALLKFGPKFSVSTSGRTSKKFGASLSVKLVYPKAPFGSEANIAKVKVSLPKQLPSRLTTLQKACVAAVFDANPANCPPASIVGHARAVTPLLPVPLTGPAYFVSHGGEAFPDLTIVIQGYGVTVHLVGSTFINKAGITSSTFKTVPDVPVGSFELTLPQGQFSALAANGDLCKSKLLMPTTFLAQNGAEIHQNTKITTTGCHKKINKHGAHKKKNRRRS